MDDFEICGWDEVPKKLKPGTILWQQGAIFDSGRGAKARISETKFRKTEKGSLIGRVNFRGNFGREPEVWGCLEDRRVVGLVAFIEKEPPPEWTCLVVTGCSRDGNALFAEHRKSLPIPIFKDFLLASYNAGRKILNAKVQEQWDVYSKCFPINLSEGLHRVFIGDHYVDGKPRAAIRYL